jgi:hypothetical protein
MYLTAQRVRHVPTGAEGINAFYYFSHVDVWNPAVRPPTIPDQDPGELVHSIITLAPPGNRVRSYLDIVARDLTPASTLRLAFATATNVQPTQLPFFIEVPHGWFRFGAEQAIAPMWRQEFGRLFEWALFVYQQTFQPAPA